MHTMESTDNANNIEDSHNTTDQATDRTIETSETDS